MKKIFEPGTRMLFFVLVLFTVVTAFFELYIAVAEGVVVLLVYLLYVRSVIRRRRDIVKYIEQVTFNVDTATKDFVVNSPLPMVVVRVPTGEILWSNNKFSAIAGERDHMFEKLLSDVIPEFNTKWFLEGKTEYPSDITLGGKIFSLTGNLVRSSWRDKPEMLGTIFFHDITEKLYLRRELMQTKAIVAVIVLDNYDELFKNVSDSLRSSILASVDERIFNWSEPANGVLRKFERDKYLFIFEERYLRTYIEERFSVLDSVREITGADNIPATLSIGIGRGSATLHEGLSYAQLATEMSLSRGGDQAVIKNKHNFEFYGGRAKEVEKRTKVKSRIVSSTLARLISDSSRVIVMGHRMSDIDSIGAAMGIAAITRKCKIPVFITVNEEQSAAKRLISQAKEYPEYANTFIDVETAVLNSDANTLLVIVDFNRPELAESIDLLQSMNRVAVIDHHRRASTYIDKADLNFHEPYASSASELVTELLQYICTSGDILRVEANALLGGIVLDTKNFALHTGVRTFEAAAFLRGAGADTIAVKILFQNDLSSSLMRHEIFRRMHTVGGNTAISVLEEPVDRTLAAQAADEMLSVTGVGASFVIFPCGEEVIVSARSLGEINVQVICERLGGGGHQLMAGAQVKSSDVESVAGRLIHAIEIYNEEANR